MKPAPLRRKGKGGKKEEKEKESTQCDKPLDRSRGEAFSYI